MEVPFTRPGTWPAPPGGIDPSRMAAHIHQTLPIACRVAILGLADDLGVRLNRGRPGAAAGPTAFRAALARYGAAHPQGWSWPIVLDAGDIIPAHGHDEAALHETHNRVTTATTALLDADLFPIAIGGGHDLTFPFVRAVANRLKADRSPPLAGIYFDAHLDVRETVGSGMAFRRLAEDCGVRELHLHGFRPLVNAREHLEWFLAHRGRVEPLHDHELPPGDCFASFDLDVIDAAFAPGVSATNPCGWLPPQAEHWMHALGRCHRVRCFDIMELNPGFDEGEGGGRTARLAAHLFLSFLRGFSERPAPASPS